MRQSSATSARSSLPLVDPLSHNPTESGVPTTRAVDPVLALSASTALCALVGALTVNWDGCATEVGTAAPLFLVLATVLTISSIYFIVTRGERIKGWSRQVGIALMAIAIVTMALTLLGISASNSGCS